jgi:predicted dehydrogenase
MPNRIASAEVWSDGRALSTVLEYPEGHRAVISWVDLPELWDFHETLEVYGGGKRVLVSYESGFSRGQSSVMVQEVEADGTSMRKSPELDWESPFRRELRHFHECIVQGKESRSPVASARDDIALIIDIAKAYMTGEAVVRG